VKDRPDALSIHGSPECPSQTSHRPSDAMREHSQILVWLKWHDRSESFSRACLSKGYLRQFDLILDVKNISGADFITMISSKTWSSDVETIVHYKKKGSNGSKLLTIGTVAPTHLSFF